MKNLRRGILGSLAAVLGLSIACGASAQALSAQWPNRPITLVVPYSPGGVTDTLARVLGEGLQAQLGQPVVVMNKAGGDTIIGSKFVLASPADGYTLYVVASQLNQMPLVAPDVFTYDALSDFTPISLLAIGPLALVASTKFAPSTLKEVMDFAKKHPGEVSVATTGSGATDHLAGELLAMRGQVKLNFIPYKGGSQAIQDVAAGNVDLRISPISSAKAFIDTGRLKVIAVFGERTPLVQGVPAVSETYRGLSVESLFGLVGPKGIPADVMERVNRATNVTMKSSAVVNKMAVLGVEAKPTSAAEWTRLLKEDTELWADLIKKSGLKVR